MDLTQYRALLKKRLLPLFTKGTQHDNVKNWIEKATAYKGEENRDANRLAICICIDLKYSLLAPEHFVSIFNSMQFEEEIEPNKQFEKSLVNNFAHFYKPSQNKITDATYNSDRYATVISWSKLSSKCNKIIPEDPIENQNAYNRYVKFKSRRLSDFNDWNGNHKKIAWVFEYTVLEKILKSGLQQSELVDFVLDTLGLHECPPGTHLPSQAKYLYIIYPLNFNSNYVCHQPTSFSGSFWLKDELYLSYKNSDGYGRTFPTSGKHPMTRERVFRAEKYSSAEFEIEELGTPSGNLQKNISTILENAESRYNGEI